MKRCSVAFGEIADRLERNGVGCAGGFDQQPVRDIAKHSSNHIDDTIFLQEIYSYFNLGLNHRLLPCPALPYAGH